MNAVRRAAGWAADPPSQTGARTSARTAPGAARHRSRLPGVPVHTGQRTGSDDDAVRVWGDADPRDHNVRLVVMRVGTAPHPGPQRRRGVPVGKAHQAGQPTPGQPNPEPLQHRQAQSVRALSEAGDTPTRRDGRRTHDRLSSEVDNGPVHDATGSSMPRPPDVAVSGRISSQRYQTVMPVRSPSRDRFAIAPTTNLTSCTGANCGTPSPRVLCGRDTNLQDLVGLRPKLSRKPHTHCTSHFGVPSLARSWSSLPKRASAHC
jgi:hypothetical protein